MLIGAHVRSTGGPLAALLRAEAIGAASMQTFTQSPRAWRPGGVGDDVLRAVRDRVAQGSAVQAVVCHAAYLVNLASPDPTLLGKSRACLADNLRVATAMGARGLAVHVGSHLGRGLDACLDQVAGELLGALDAVPDACPILLENTAGAGGTIGRSIAELAAIIDRAGSDPRLGLCLDTAHLWGAGIPFGTPGEVDALLEAIDTTVGVARVLAVHLNDSKAGFGSGRDLHENPGVGAIGRKRLGAFLGHPALQGLPALLEVPGFGGDGPTAADMRNARRLHAAGRRLYGDGVRPASRERA